MGSWKFNRETDFGFLSEPPFLPVISNWDKISIGVLLAPLGRGTAKYCFRQENLLRRSASVAMPIFPITFRLSPVNRLRSAMIFCAGSTVVIFDSDFHEISPEMRHAGNGKTVPVKIGRNVWIESRCIIMKWSTNGDNSIIGAGSVVCGTIPPRCIAAGIPAQKIRSI